jgi:hypothetical protein
MGGSGLLQGGLLQEGMTRHPKVNTKGPLRGLMFVCRPNHSPSHSLVGEMGRKVLLFILGIVHICRLRAF